MRASHTCLTLLLSGALVAPAAWAQGRPIELGLDAGISFNVSDPNVTQISIPVQDLRAGFFLTDAVALEPRLALNYFKVENVDALTSITAAVGALIHFQPDRSRAQPFARPFGGLTYLDLGDDSETQFSLGGGIGIKLPIAEQLGARVEGSFAHAFETDALADSDTIVLTVGFSFYTR
jgi:hypothetical protein